MIAGPEHEKIFQDFCKVLKKYADKLTAAEMLAIVSNMVGKLLAQQDQRKMSAEQALQIVRANIEIGNRQMIDELMNSKGSA